MKKAIFIHLTLVSLLVLFQNCSQQAFDSRVTELSQGSSGAPPPEITPVKSVTIAWDKSGSSSVVGYSILIGTQSGNYTQTINVGLSPNPERPQYVIENLEIDTNYYVVVKAYDGQGSFSSASNEIIIAK